MEKRIGEQDPSIAFILPYQKTEAPGAIDLYQASGQTVLEWQQGVLYDIMAVNDDGIWTHTTFGYAVPRQNGKGEILIIRELRGLAYGERIIHTAHLVSTAHAAFEKLLRILDLIGLEKGKDYFSIKAKGQEQIRLKQGGVIDFRTRTNTGGLGESYDLLVIDEAQEYQTTHKTALQYVISASKNPQTIMCGTPPTVVSSGTVFKDYRDAVLKGSRQNSGWAEWSVDEMSDANDKDLWYKTNPSLGILLSERTIIDEIDDTESGQIDFNIQRLGLWLKYDQKSAISEAAWKATNVKKLPAFVGKIAVGIKYNKDGMTVSMAVAVKTADGKIFVEAVGRHQVREGPAWIIKFLQDIGNANTLKVIVDGQNGQEILKSEMSKARLNAPKFPRVSEVIEANQRFEDAVYQKTLVHMEQPSLTQIVTKSEHRAIGSHGGFGYQPINDLMDISLMDSVIYAHWAIASIKDVKQKISY